MRGSSSGVLWGCIFLGFSGIYVYGVLELWEILCSRTCVVLDEEGRGGGGCVGRGWLESLTLVGGGSAFPLRFHVSREDR